MDNQCLMADKSYDPRQSSVAVGGDDGGKKRKLIPLLLALAALLLLALVIGLVSCGGDDEKETAAAPSTSTATTQSTPSTPKTPDVQATPATGTGGATLTANSASLLDQDAGTIGDNVGEDATGSGLKVLSVTEAGFFVGKSDTDRQFVEFGGEVGGDEVDEELPAVGDVVSIEGPVKEAPADPAKTLKLDEADAQLVTERGAYVNADSVTPAG